MDGQDVEIDGLLQLLHLMPEACPRIEHLQVYQVGLYPIPEADIVQLLQGYPRGLKTLHLTFPYEDDDLIFSILVQTSAVTLRSLHFELLEDSPSLPCEIIDRIVQDFPQLEELSARCRCSQESSEPCEHAGLDLLVETGGKRRATSCWFSGM